MAGRGKAKHGGAGSPKPHAGRTAASKALGTASGGEPSGPAASAAPVRRSPRTTPAATSTSAQPQQTATSSPAPTRRSPRNTPAATPTSASAEPTRRSPRNTPAATPTSAQPHHRAVTMGRSPVSVATVGRSGPAATAISAQTQHRAVTRNRGMVPPMFYTEKPTRTNQASCDWEGQDTANVQREEEPQGPWSGAAIGEAEAQGNHVPTGSAPHEEAGDRRDGRRAVLDHDEAPQRHAPEHQPAERQRQQQRRAGVRGLQQASAAHCVPVRRLLRQPEQVPLVPCSASLSLRLH